VAYSEELAARVRTAIGARENISERKMFGGIAFMVDGKMFIGLIGEELMCRVGVDAYDEALSRPGTRLMDFTGRPMKGYVYAGSPGIDSDEGIQSWVDQTLAFVSSLPAKAPKTTAPRRSRNPR